MMRYNRLFLMVAVIGGFVLCGPAVHAQVITYYAPVVTPAVSTPVTTYYAPASTAVTAYYAPAPVTSYYAPIVSSAPVTTYYAPAASTVPVTSYYAPAAATTVLSPVSTVVRSPYWVYDPSRILPGRRWSLVY